MISVPRLLALLFVAWCGGGNEDFAPIPPDRLIGIARLIVAGRIAEVGSDVLTATVDRTVAGEAQGATIRIRPFVPSKFEGTPRAVPYAAGQSYVWFLVPDSRGGASAPWRILGTAGEGERPVKDGRVRFPWQPESTTGSGQSAPDVELSALADAIAGYRSCLRWQGPQGDLPVPSLRCDAAALDAFAAKSAVHKQLADLTRKRFATQ